MLLCNQIACEPGSLSCSDNLHRHRTLHLKHALLQQWLQSTCPDALISRSYLPHHIGFYQWQQQLANLHAMTLKQSTLQTEYSLSRGHTSSTSAIVSRRKACGAPSGGSYTGTVAINQNTYLIQFSHALGFGLTDPIKVLAKNTRHSAVADSFPHQTSPSKCI